MTGNARLAGLDSSAVLQLSVKGMGCEACQLHVQGLMNNVAGVMGSQVDWTTGKAELIVNEESFDFASLNRLLEDDGYSASVKSEL